MSEMTEAEVCLLIQLRSCSMEEKSRPVCLEKIEWAVKKCLQACRFFHRCCELRFILIVEDLLSVFLGFSNQLSRFDCIFQMTNCEDCCCFVSCFGFGF